MVVDASAGNGEKESSLSDGIFGTMKSSMKAGILLAVYLGFPGQPSQAFGNRIQFDDLKCKLPGWPGHPAPSCDPNLPKQCCVSCFDMHQYH